MIHTHVLRTSAVVRWGALTCPCATHFRFSVAVLSILAVLMSICDRPDSLQSHSQLQTTVTALLPGVVSIVVSGRRRKPSTGVKVNKTLSVYPYFFLIIYKSVTITAHTGPLKELSTVPSDDPHACASNQRSGAVGRADLSLRDALPI